MATVDLVRSAVHRLRGGPTHTGTVTAAHDWGDPHDTMRVRPGMPGSYEALFHAAGV